MVKSMAELLNSEASDDIRAARIPQTTKPFTPAGSILATRVGKAASAFGVPSGSNGKNVAPAPKLF